MTETIYSILVIRRRVFKRSVVCILGIPMAEAVRQSRGRNWCGTLNNPGGDVKVEAVLRACADVRYACGQREVGGVNGTEHDQFYVEFSTTYTLSAVRGLLPRAHWEVRRGTKREARDYCRKEETRVPDTQWEIGVWVNNRGGGKELEDLAVIQRRLAEGGRSPKSTRSTPRLLQGIPVSWIGLRTMRRLRGRGRLRLRFSRDLQGAERLASLMSSILASGPNPLVFGLTPTTDTLMSLLMTLREGGIVASASGTSFGSLTGTLWTSLLRGFKRWVPRVIVITTNVEPRDWYPWEDFAPLERRIDEIRRWDA